MAGNGRPKIGKAERLVGDKRETRERRFDADRRRKKTYYRWMVALQDVSVWPEIEVSRHPQFGRDRVESGHASDIAEVKRLPPNRQAIADDPIYGLGVGSIT
jgi:hypothetical protein